jgi:hypothetical protein
MIVVCLGMPRSGSTWAFNVVREMIEAASGEVSAFEASNLSALDSIRLGPARSIVIRCHTLNGSMLRLMLAANAKFVLTTRDPRDCVASLCQQLGGRAAGWCTEVVRSLASVGTVGQEGVARQLAFEDRFTDDPNTLFDLARFLELTLSDDILLRIAASWSKEAVRARIESIRTNEPSIYGFRSDTVTGLNEAHIGDGRIGKWHEVLPRWEAEIIDRTFSGCATPQLGPQSGDVIRFSESMFSMAAQPTGIERFPTNVTSLGQRLMGLCYLSTGPWRISLRGAIPARPYPYWLRIVTAGQTQVETLINCSGTQCETAIDLGFEFESRSLDQMEILLEGEFPTLPDPFRPSALEIEACRL